MPLHRFLSSLAHDLKIKDNAGRGSDRRQQIDKQPTVAAANVNCRAGRGDGRMLDEMLRILSAPLRHRRGIKFGEGWITLKQLEHVASVFINEWRDPRCDKLR